MRFRLGDSGSGAAIGCGALAVLLGWVILSPVGILLIKTIGWATTILGVLMMVMGIIIWVAEAQRRDD